MLPVADMKEPHFATPTSFAFEQSERRSSIQFHCSGLCWSIDDSSEQDWICLFTCFVTRAVHLDIVLDISTETFIRYLKRFAARRGLPQRFISDNDKALKAASRFLKSVFKDDAVHDHLAEKGCE